MSDEAKLAVWQYYYKDNACPAEYSRSENCICWHNEGSGPFPKLKNGDEIPLAYGSAVGLTWRRVPAPAVPDDVAAIIAELRADAELHQDLLPDRAADTIEALAASVDRANAANEALCADVEAQAAELARLKSRLRMIVSHATMGSTDGEGQSTNDICVRITDLRNELYQDAKAAALTQTTGD